MITTDFVPGSPCWVELSASDLRASLDFYHGLFGWEAESAGPDTGGYMILRSGGKAVGGAGPLMEEGQPPAWTIYFTSTDAAATARTVAELGGTVHVDAMDVMDMGVMSHFSDPQGVHFAVWQPLSFPGMEVADEPGSLVWVELWTPDDEGAKKFYGDLFGWNYTAFELPEGAGTYQMITPRGQTEERMHGGLMQADPQMLAPMGGGGDWHPVFHAEDPDTATAKVAETGGQVFMGPEDAEGVGRLSTCADPDGNVFVLLKPSPM
ncbi:VOC family protein [Nocardiopsis sp. NRRL B-16309]|uniref:VOC family protein n=1 Tax=Nocardiopsis sp. NRRL B-16309 TaxID=1519494 RepID=UPI0006B017E6|nr:VOC family protein [Nocardiopsis sp. NRRL B-16309]KOX11311.1 hydroxylase [Nocardiopsis sp. NRRL B-16309]